MTTHVVAVCRRVPGELIVPGARIQSLGDEMPTRAQVLENVRGASIAVTMYSDKVNQEFLDAAGPSLRGVCNFAVGYENIDLELCKQRGVMVTNTPNAVTEGTADLAWLLVMAAARRLIEADRYARSPEYPARGALGMAEFLGVDLTGRTLLIVGAGRIGYGVAMRSQGWGMRVLYTARSRHWEFELAPLAATRVELHEGLRQADVVSIHCPLTPDTRHLINAQAIACMKPTAILVNTARGPVVHEQALVDALREGRLYSAGLDVYEHEPKVHPDLVANPRVVLTPHIGSAEAKYRVMMTEMVAQNATAILAGSLPPNRIA
jgi:glyoxylate reductase